MSSATAVWLIRGEASVFQSKSFSPKSFSPKSWWQGVVNALRTLFGVLRVTVLTKVGRSVTSHGKRRVVVEL